MKTLILTDEDATKLSMILEDCRGVAYYDGLVNSFFKDGEQKEGAPRDLHPHMAGAGQHPGEPDRDCDHPGD